MRRSTDRSTFEPFFDVNTAEGVERDRVATAVAFADVKAAFDYYMKHYNRGRPFVLGGHSQGALHTYSLLRDLTPAQRRKLVAAYPIGISYDPSLVPIPVCESAEETGCYATWNTNTADAIIKIGGGAWGNYTCVNPISWRTDGAYVANSTGGLVDGDVVYTDAQCRGLGELVVTANPKLTSMSFGPGNYHILDVNLFYMDIRTNVQARVDRFLM